MRPSFLLLRLGFERHLLGIISLSVISCHDWHQPLQEVGFQLLHVPFVLSPPPTPTSRALGVVGTGAGG